MEKQTKNLGHVTAYGYAKSQGYEGTEAEYAELMASYATVAERAEAAADEAAESAQEVKDVIPEVTAQDNGKVMMVENGAWGAGEVDVLPTVTAQDNGKVLGVVAGQWAPAEPEDGLPSVTSSDNGKVLSVVEGEWAPAEPTGGSGLPEVTSEDNGDLLSVVDGTWAKSEPGYRVENSETVIAPEQSVTTSSVYGGAEAAVQNAEWPDPRPDSIVAVFNGTEYVLPRVDNPDDPGAVALYYGAFDFDEYLPIFTTYPLVVTANRHQPQSCQITTPEPGTYTLEIAYVQEILSVSEDFKLAVNNSYMVPSEVEVVPEQTVEAADQGGYVVAYLTNAVLPSTPPETLSVTLNGTVYEAAAQRQGGGVMYGEPSLQAVPFAIGFFGGTVQMLVPEAGTYTVHATAEAESVNPKFQEAAAQAAAPFAVVYTFVLDGGSTPPAVQQFGCDKTYAQIEDAINSGRTVIAYLDQLNGQPLLPMQRVGKSYDGGFQFASISPYYDSQAGSLALYSVSIEHTDADDYIYYSGSVAATDVAVYHKPS